MAQVHYKVMIFGTCACCISGGGGVGGVCCMLLAAIIDCSMLSGGGGRFCSVIGSSDSFLSEEGSRLDGMLSLDGLRLLNLPCLLGEL